MNAVVKPAMFAIALLVAGFPIQVLAQAQECTGDISADFEPNVKACTAKIQSGRLSNKDLVRALDNRGSAYLANGRYDLAILGGAVQ